MKILDIEEGYDRFAPLYKKQHAHLDSFDWERAMPWIQECLEGQRSRGGGGVGPAVLDAGCGDGRVLARLERWISKNAKEGSGPALRLHGWDLSPGMLQAARKRLDKDVTLVRADILDPPLAAVPEGGFSLVLAFFLLVHLPHPQDFFTVMARILAPGGLVLCNTLPQPEGFVVRGAGQDFAIRWHDHQADRVVEDLEAAGLELVDRRDGPWSTLVLGRRRT